jgi:glyoxylase-like metal-dependent hydrolase (beta-lactamase superfamily II)
MKVHVLCANAKTYSCRAYLVCGSWNRLEDVNTLIDTGSDGSIIAEIERVSTGVGKKGVDQVLLTHGHFDHTGGLAAVIARYRPVVRAFGKNPGVDAVLRHGEALTLGDTFAEVLHTPGHTQDSACFYVAADKALFSGDTPLKIMTASAQHTPEFLASIEMIAALRIATVYPGHGDPWGERVAEILQLTLRNVRQGGLQPAPLAHVK